MALSDTNLPSIALMFLLMLLANKVHSTSFNIQSFDSNPNADNLIYQGDAHVPSNEDGTLRLTRTNSAGTPQSNSVGRVLYSEEIDFWSPGRQSSFETTIRFRITSPPSGGPADGLAFFIAPVSTTIPTGSSGANLGIFPSSGSGSNIFAVEFDVYVDSAWDPNYRHIGIDINSRNSRNTTRFESALDQVVTARINYVASARTITVVAIYDGQIPEVSYVFDLKTILPRQVRVGISAATGTEVATFDVLTWIFQSTMEDDNSVSGRNCFKELGAYIQQYV